MIRFSKILSVFLKILDVGCHGIQIDILCQVNGLYETSPPYFVFFFRRAAIVEIVLDSCAPSFDELLPRLSEDIDYADCAMLYLFI